MADLDKLLKKLAEEKKTYAEWQGERYPVRVTHREALDRAEMLANRNKKEEEN